MDNGHTKDMQLEDYIPDAQNINDFFIFFWRDFKISFWVSKKLSTKEPLGFLLILFWDPFRFFLKQPIIILQSKHTSWESPLPGLLVYFPSTGDFLILTAREGKQLILSPVRLRPTGDSTFQSNRVWPVGRYTYIFINV